MEYLVYLWAVLLILGLCLSQVLQLFSMPANWVALGLVVLWKIAYPLSMTWTFILVLTIMATLAEVMEFFLQARYAGRYGASNRGNVGGIIGAIAGAIFGAPFFFGLGALLGALGGAYAGCLLAEMPGRTRPEAMRAAKGAFVGKALGFTMKIAIGAVIVVMSMPRIWP
ncbi:conserved membrane protein of unknown function [Pseudodesulfovibrio profundus]|uniref:DUF456 domain-containing protein n=1 Tax=Pseudodesulfovibrio profundus TaxID=57320 RepID=A0A2C8F687_9BACT|nr:DUF456 domain-containing protein [Pseudodesulfovibrio profundus]SOB58108.1 conserved membrane protein of unknown function [Pseudodesulfovibrio profundus]